METNGQLVYSPFCISIHLKGWRSASITGHFGDCESFSVSQHVFTHWIEQQTCIPMTFPTFRLRYYQLKDIKCIWLTFARLYSTNKWHCRDNKVKDTVSISQILMLSIAGPKIYLKLLIILKIYCVHFN